MPPLMAERRTPRGERIRRGGPPRPACRTREISAAMERRRAGAKRSREDTGWRWSGGPVLDDRRVLGRYRRCDVDQGAADIGKRQAEVADLARLVAQSLGVVDGPKQLGQPQRGGKTNRAKPRAQGRRDHSLHPTPAKARRNLRRSPPAHNPEAPTGAGAQPDFDTPRHWRKESARPLISWKY